MKQWTTAEHGSSQASTERVIKKSAWKGNHKRYSHLSAYQDKINHKHAYLAYSQRFLVTEFFSKLPIKFLFQYLPLQFFSLIPNLTLLYFHPINFCSFLREHEDPIFFTAASNVFADLWCLSSISVDNCFSLFS